MVTDVTPLLTDLAMELVVLALAAVLSTYIWWRSRPKYFYIVRHGETLLNEAHIKQGSEGSLSPKGMEQAKAIGSQFKDLGIRAIYSSPYTRALETADLISQELGVKITPSPLLAERKNPSEVIGKSTNDPDVVSIMGQTEYGYHDDSFRYSDEENFEDLSLRARKCLQYLQKVSGNKIAVVTHHAFLQMFLSYMLYREKLTAQEYAKLGFFNPADNGGVTVCVYHPFHSPFSKTKGWEILSYNQH